jgi:predicted Fe-Mo cluster-binding NifX family protein
MKGDFLMKIAITAQGMSLDDNIEPRFGRSPIFIILDTDTMDFEAIENSNAALGGGAGIGSAKLMLDKNVESVLTGNCGPKAFQVFEEARIKVFVGLSGKIKDIVEDFKAGKFKPSNSANVSEHSGTGR